MSQFKTQAEIWQALVEGKKIGSNKLIDGEYYQMKDGGVVYKDGATTLESFSSFKEFYIYEPPKPKKILKPFLIGYAQDDIILQFYQSEDVAKALCKKQKMMFLGQANGIPDQEVDGG